MGHNGRTTLRTTKARVAAVAAAALASAAMSSFSLAAPASADPVFNDLRPISYAYTDSAHPGKSYMNPDSHTDLPVGAIAADGGTSRVYATFDLTPYVGKHVVVAHLFGDVNSAVDCTKTAAEVWQTATPGKSVAWDKAPAEIAKIGSLPLACGVDLTQIDVTSAVVGALGNDHASLSIEIRVPDGHETDPAYAFTFYGDYGIKLDVGGNTPPTTPTALKAGSNDCSISASAPDHLNTLQPALEASTTDVDQNSQIKGDFAIWPVGHPDQRTTFSSAFGPGPRIATTVPVGVLSDGGSYAWQVQADDGIGTSDWSQTCYFDADVTPPAAPGVNSPNYPAGDTLDPAGAPMTFYFTPSGADDVVKYGYGFAGDPGNVFVSADADGAATVTLNPPNWGTINLTVASYDRAGNQSRPTTYRFFLQATGPIVTHDANAEVGAPFHFSMTPNPNAPQPVDSYQVRVNDGDWTTVTADANGNASSSYTPGQGMNLQIDIRSHSANGWLSDPNTINETVTVPPTQIASSDYPEYPAGPSGGVGITGTFTLTATLPNAASFTYEFDDGDVLTVDADATGHASITYTPDTAGLHILYALETTVDGTVSDAGSYEFLVNG